MESIKYTILILAFAIGINQRAEAQCKTFTKKQCMDLLGNYTGNGQYNGAVLFEGEEASVIQPFYSGKDYRLVVCAHASIKDSVYFEIRDYAKNLIYSSRGSGVEFFDFSVETTQQLSVRVVVPKMGTANELKKNGCVSILVGFKETR